MWNLIFAAHFSTSFASHKKKKKRQAFPPFAGELKLIVSNAAIQLWSRARLQGCHDRINENNIGESHFIHVVPREKGQRPYFNGKCQHSRASRQQCCERGLKMKLTTEWFAELKKQERSKVVEFKLWESSPTTASDNTSINSSAFKCPHVDRNAQTRNQFHSFRRPTSLITREIHISVPRHGAGSSLWTTCKCCRTWLHFRLVWRRMKARFLASFSESAKAPQHSQPTSVEGDEGRGKRGRSEPPTRRSEMAEGAPDTLLQSVCGGYLFHNQMLFSEGWKHTICRVYICLFCVLPMRIIPTLHSTL